MKEIKLIKEVLDGNYDNIRNEKWLTYITITDAAHINMERVEKVSDINNKYLLNYVMKTLETLDESSLNNKCFSIVKEVLLWSEVAKGGTKAAREKWRDLGFNLASHNIGSSEVYGLSHDNQIVRVLIQTHGLIGQYIRGEINFSENEPLHELLAQQLLSRNELRDILREINKCVVTAVSTELWDSIESEVKVLIEKILDSDFSSQFSIVDRLKRLRSISIEDGEDIDYELSLMCDDKTALIEKIFKSKSLWYVEAALSEFTFEEFIKILALTQIEPTQNCNLSFERLMRGLYYDFRGQKKVNIYKKRIIEKYLSDVDFIDIRNGVLKENSHIYPQLISDNGVDSFTFVFSTPSEKLIEFCEAAEDSGSLYEKAIIMLFDLFDLRRDKFDRFHNEDDYLRTMNKSSNHKAILLNYLKGTKIIDVGPGGGAVMDMIEEYDSKLNITGIDISTNVVEQLNKKKNKEGRNWKVIQGDALQLEDYVGKEQVSTIIFCSIIHELFSYIEYEGKKFNHDVIKKVLKSSINALEKGGRIIIRDGIMTEPEDAKRIIRFRTNEGISFLKRYQKDFKGRTIEFELIGQNEVIMPINDAMEFLYTYTWGEESYVHEVNEQFGYFTPKKYREYIEESIGDSARIIEFKHFLQDGYEVALESKIVMFDENRNEVRLPDSTCIIVIQKN